MGYEFYLAWIGNEIGWEVFDRRPASLDLMPVHTYKKYDVEVDNGCARKVFRNLLCFKHRLSIQKVRPTEGNYEEIFPELENLLKYS